MSKDSKKAKYREIAEDLKAAIHDGQIRPGQYLPSQNDLVNQYGVALGTVRQAVGLLNSAGWVQTEKGRGTYVSAPNRRGSGGGSEQTKQDTIGYAVIGEYDHHEPMNQLILHSVFSEIHPAGKKLAYGIFPEGEDFYQRFSEFLTGLSGVLVYSRVTSDVLDIIRSHRVRCVILGHVLSADVDCQDFTNISADLRAAGYMLAQAVAMHGHRRVGLVGQKSGLAFDECWEGCHQGCQEHQIYSVELSHKFGMKPAGQIQTLYDPGELVQAIHEEQLTCLIVYGDRQACQLIQDLKVHNVCVPEQCSFIAVGGSSRKSLINQGLTRVNLNLDAVGKQAARYLIEAPQQVVQRFLPPRLELRESMAPLDPAGKFSQGSPALIK